MDKTDINIPKHEKYLKGFSEDGWPLYNWPDNLGFDLFTVKGISKENALPKEWDRYGSMNGKNFATLEKKVYNYSERALPYVYNKEAYHKGRFNVDSYFDKIDAIKNKDMECLNRILLRENLDTVSVNLFNKIVKDYEKYIFDIKSTNFYIDVTYGIIGKASCWDDLVGGASQIVTPLNGYYLKTLGILK